MSQVWTRAIISRQEQGWYPCTSLGKKEENLPTLVPYSCFRRLVGNTRTTQCDCFGCITVRAQCYAAEEALNAPHTRTGPGSVSGCSHLHTPPFGRGAKSGAVGTHSALARTALAHQSHTTLHLLIQYSILALSIGPCQMYLRLKASPAGIGFKY